MFKFPPHACQPDKSVRTDSAQSPRSYDKNASNDEGNCGMTCNLDFALDCYYIFNLLKWHFHHLRFQQLMADIYINFTIQTGMCGVYITQPNRFIQ